MKERLISAKIMEQHNSPKASIIIGPRQVGKTTILKNIHQKLGGLFFDLDIFTQYDQIATYEKFLATLKVNGYKENQTSTFYVFLDEFQRYADLSRVIKSVYDHHKNIKIFATGSSSLEIKNSIQESLAGRKILTFVYPFDFKEFLFFKDRSDLIEKIEKLPQIQTADYFSSIPEAYELLKEFLIFGGYPDVVLAENSEGKQTSLRSIFDLYIKKDFLSFAKIEKLRNVSQLMQILAINNGQTANYAKYAAATGLSVETIKNYLSILEETFILSVVRPFYTNKNKEVSKMPKVYFLDNGVRNFFLSNFAPIEKHAEAGALFEGFYLSEMIKRNINPETIKHYRTKNGEEIDFILEHSSKIIPIEIKFKKAIRKRDTSSLERFMENYSLSQSFIVTTGELNKKNSIQSIDCFNDYFNKL